MARKLRCQHFGGALKAVVGKFAVTCREPAAEEKAKWDRVERSARMELPVNGFTMKLNRRASSRLSYTSVCVSLFLLFRSSESVLRLVTPTNQRVNAVNSSGGNATLHDSIGTI